MKIKKIISLLLIVVLLICNTLPNFANNEPQTETAITDINIENMSESINDVKEDISILETNESIEVEEETKLEIETTKKIDINDEIEQTNFEVDEEIVLENEENDEEVFDDFLIIEPTAEFEDEIVEEEFENEPEEDVEFEEENEIYEYEDKKTEENIEVETENITEKELENKKEIEIENENIIDEEIKIEDIKENNEDEIDKNFLIEDENVATESEAIFELSDLKNDYEIENDDMHMDENDIATKSFLNRSLLRGSGKSIVMASIIQSPHKTNYAKDTSISIDLRGLIIRFDIDDGTYENVEFNFGDTMNWQYGNRRFMPDPGQLGLHQIEVIYLGLSNYENSSSEFPVTVDLYVREIQNLEVLNMPNKSQYKGGEQLSLDGLVVRINYTDGTYEDFEKPTGNGWNYKLVGSIKGEYYRSKFIYNLSLGSYNRGYNNKNEWLVSNDQVLDTYNKDGYCGFIFTTNGFVSLFYMLKQAYKKDYKVTNKDMPILLIAGSEDKVVVSKKKFEHLFKFLMKEGYNAIDSEIYDGMRHEILNESGHEKVYERVASFIDKK